jgi:hypothetical protein
MFRACSTTLVLLVLGSAPFGAGCSKKDEAKAAPAGSTSAAAKADGKKKLPAKTEAKGEKKHGKKGGSGEKPKEASHKAGAATQKTEKKTKVEVAENPCANLADGTASCGDATHLYVCVDKELWQVDCNGLMTAAYPDLFTAGACYETDQVTDCMGVGVAEDGVAEACTSDLSLCCDEEGTCFMH